MHLWFALDTNVWYQAFTEAQVKDQMLNPLPEDTTLTAYDYRGGFPIFAWIKEWDPMVWDHLQNDMDVGETETPPSEALSCVSVYPSLEGREMPLFTGDPASGPYQYSLVLSRDVLESSSADDIIVSLTPALPDPRFTTTVYFSITLEKFGPYVQDNTAWYNPVKWSDWEGWWPASYMRVRVLYGIYGEFAYLWTKSEAEHWEYDWENRTSTYEVWTSAWTQFWEGVADWLANPVNQLWVFIILIVAVIIVVSVASPGLWTTLASKHGNG